MSQIEFENQTGQKTAIFTEDAPQGMIGWVMKHSKGKIATPSQAAISLIVLAILLLLVAGFIAFGFSSEPSENSAYVDPVTGLGIVPGRDPNSF